MGSKCRIAVVDGRERIKHLHVYCMRHCPGKQARSQLYRLSPVAIYALSKPIN